MTSSSTAALLGAHTSIFFAAGALVARTVGGIETWSVGGLFVHESSHHRANKSTDGLGLARTWRTLNQSESVIVEYRI